MKCGQVEISKPEELNSSVVSSTTCRVLGRRSFGANACLFQEEAADLLAEKEQEDKEGTQEKMRIIFQKGLTI